MVIFKKNQLKNRSPKTNKEREHVNKILILTKNILAEQQLQKQLQLLDYEVFCTTEIFRNPRSYAIFQYFPIILLSETISNVEIEKFLAAMNHKANLIVRLIVEQSNEEVQVDWRTLGIDGELIKNASLDSLREKLVMLQSDYYGQKAESTDQECPPIQKWEKRTIKTADGSVFFSKKEERLFKLLLESKDKLLSRHHICTILWPEGETDSNRSQLSCIASKIKTKFKEAGYEGETIITKWGQGYGLDPKFYHYLSTGQVQKDHKDSNSDNFIFNKMFV